MAIETFEFIDDLNAANPTATDNVSEGDDHLRGLKTTLKNTFPNVTGAINATETELNYVDGVTSAIQTQLDAKLATGGTIATATITTLGSTTVNATTVDLGNWTVTESAGVLKFATGGVDKAKLDASGNFTVVGDVTAFGTI
jgi:hypothetical protein